MFEFDPDPAPTAEQAFKDAEGARRGGYRIAQKELEDASGYSLIPDGDSGGGTAGFPVNVGGKTVQNSATPPDPVAIQCLGGQVAPDGGGSGVDAPNGADAPETAVDAFLGDAGKWREMAERLMGDPSPETAKQILAELQRRPSALARAMEEWMAENFAEALEKDGAVQNKDGDCRAKDPSKCPTHGTGGGGEKEKRRKNEWTDEDIRKRKEDVGGLAEEALSDRRSNKTVSLGKVSGDAVGDIRQATGVDVSGYEQTISSMDIRHADIRHGARERSKGQVPLSAGDYGRIPEVYSDYDSIKKGTPETNTGRQSVRYRKAMSDGTLVVVEVITDKKEKRMRFKTMWKEKH